MKNLEKTFLLRKRIELRRKYSNIDALYGPYYIDKTGAQHPDYESFENIATLETALLNYAEVGLTVGIINGNNNNQFAEYWFQKKNDRLALDSKGLHTKLDELNITNVASEGNTVSLTYESTGSSIFPTTPTLSVYERYSNGLSRRVALLNFNAEGDTIHIYNVPEGIHHYYIQVIDFFSNKITSEDTGPITIGKVKIYYDLGLIKNLYVINKSNLLSANYSFLYNIDILDENWRNVPFYLYANDTKIFEEALVTDYDGNQPIYINESFFANINGGTINIKGIKEATGEVIKQDLFTILSEDTINVERADSISTFYAGVTKKVSFTFSSGAQYATISSGENSDFSFSQTNIDFSNITGDAKKTIKLTPRLLEEEEEQKDNAQLIIKYKIGNYPEKQISLFMGKIVPIPSAEHIDNWDTIPNSNVSLSPFYFDFSGIITACEEGQKILQLSNNIYIDNDIIRIGNLKVATPLNLEVYIGLGYHLTDTNENLRNEDNTPNPTTYNCICINGMVVKTQKITDTQYPAWNFVDGGTIEYGETVDGLKLRHIYLLSNTEGLLTQSGDILCEKNFFEDSKYFDGLNNSSNETLPKLFLIAKKGITEELLGSYPNKWKDELHPAKFGSIADGNTKITSFEKFRQGTPPKLLQMHTNIKSDAQKIYGVVCDYFYDSSGEYEDVSLVGLNEFRQVIVYTLGTSTLKYAIPNFKFFFLDNDKLIPIEIGGKTCYETILTAKADYMDSSHLNNTPTAILYNEIVNDDKILGLGGIADRSLAIRANNNQNNLSPYADAIVGMPISLYIKDIDKETFTNYGSFMLNTDKVSDSLGFKLNDPDGESGTTCLSFEGTANTNRGSAARFIADENDASGQNPEDDEVTNDSSLQNLATTGFMKIEDNLLNKDIDTLDSDEKHLILRYLARGFEYRYPDRDIIKVKNGLTDYKMPEEDFVLFYSMWKAVCTHTLYDEESPLGDIFYLPYCYLYIIFFIVFGLADNLGKNCMFDCWKEEVDDPNHPGEKILLWGKWYPRPYDLDSQCGLNNGGAEVIPPYVMVNEKWLPGDIDISNIQESDYIYKYIDSRKNMFGYASSESKLWSTIYLENKGQIEALYSELRKGYFNYDKLIQHFKSIVIDKISVHLYNIDFLNKYLGTAQLHYMMGNRWTNFLDWLRARLAFCDSFFNYKKATFNMMVRKTLSVSQIFPAFVIVNYESRTSYGFGKLVNLSGVGASGDVAETITLSDSIITNLNLYDWTFSQLAPDDEFEFTNLKSLKINGLNSPDLTKCLSLESLEIGPDSGLESLIVPKSVKKLIINNQNLSSIAFEASNFLEECSIENISMPLKSLLNFGECSHLKKLILRNNDIKSLVLSNNHLETFISEGNSFSDISISLSSIPRLDLSNLNISSLNFENAKIDQIDLYNCLLATQILNLSTLKFPKNEDISEDEISDFTLNIIKSNIQKVYIDSKFSKLHSLRLGVLESDLEHFGLLEETEEETEEDLYVDLTLFPDSDKITSIFFLGNTENTPLYEPILILDNIIYDSLEDKYKTQATIVNTLTVVDLEKRGLCLGRTLITDVMLPSNKEIQGNALFAKCLKLVNLSINLADPCYISSDFAFYDCPKLELGGGNPCFKLRKFKGAFIGTTISYPTVESTIDNVHPNATDFSYFYCFAKPSQSHRTFTVDTSNYPINITSVVGMFKNFYETSFIYRDSTYNKNDVKRLDITIKGKFVENEGIETFNNQFTSLALMFEGNIVRFIDNDNEEVQNTFLSETQQENITNIERTFRGGLISFNPMGFLNGLINVDKTVGLYASCEIYYNPGGNEINLILPSGCTKLNNISAMFLDAEFLSVDRVKIDDFLKYIDISSNTTTNPTMTIKAECCFYNCLKAFIEDNLIINNSISTINFGGFLGQDTNLQNFVPTKIVTNSKFNIRADAIYVGTGETSNPTLLLRYLGSFKGRRVDPNLLQLSLSGNNILHYCRGIKANNNLTIKITNSNNITNICSGASGIIVEMHDLLANCNAESAFEKCTFAIGLSFGLNNISNAKAMFKGSSLLRITFNLPDSIRNVTEMFSECTLLTDGLPNNFFPNNGNFTDISSMFFKTLIFVPTSNDQNRDIQIPLYITKAQGTFARTDKSTLNSSIINSRNINFSNSGNLSDITGIFASSSISSGNVNNLINALSNNTNASYAFVNNGLFYNSDLVNKVINAEGMFAYSDPYDRDIPVNIPTNIINTGMFDNWNNGGVHTAGFNIPNEWISANDFTNA